MIILDTWGHLNSTESEEELHKFARKLGLKREWYQEHPRHPHYDLTTKNMNEKALSMGATLVKGRDAIGLPWWANKTYETCINCAIHHYENCNTCFGFGIHIAIDPKSGQGHPSAITAAEAITGPTVANKEYRPCPECKSTLKGVPK